ncbi:hypothetical protein [Marinibacterium sp. SX1]|uniref:hypothetical protein n=1 Tax=Marinibacterium sp. SX1 TaxID=3388424 RepID=UPI003D16EF00
MAGADQRVSVPVGTETPVIALTYVGGFIDSEDRIRTRVFVEGNADARRYVLELYRPAYMKDAGTFRTELTEAEFNRLLRSFGDENVLAVQQEELLDSVRAEVAARGPGLVLDDTHDARVEIEFRLAGETAAGGMLAPDLRSLAVPTSALEVAARAQPSALRNVASGVLEIEGLLRLKTLERVQ